ncbi:TMEM175 family protein [Schleiferilactobacillus shenzhenensis]|uniref:DUF1211 domain-containing protein n=1 Tax=Schleiferilactobacillus shenzhenensis LY-73 TaxID=1231336 RepID=U4THU0_9LACO|nr:TMEM175 family protein [Schleiferilactobacillus shenzhenensis]ERL64336.1 hypothetical protein L248_0998 [Schleiferilactobacillus shenzhenensis LY-73]
MSVSRFQAFSDGVFAILITILVLSFQVPDYHAGHLFTAVLNQWPIMAAYVVSYFYVGTLWLFHHDYFNTLVRIDRGVNMLNLLLLFSITLIDYPMALVANTLATGNVADMRVAFIMYDLVALFVSFTFFLMYLYLHHHMNLKAPHVTTDFYTTIKFDPLRSVAIYGASIIAAFFSIPLSALLLVLGILFHFFAYLRMSRNLRTARVKRVESPVSGKK